ncbi:MAG: response regulator [Tepidisphaera sp.]|nr:response regulator [Tepidisphaera sp.]
MRVLLAEDSDSLQRSISRGLREHGYAVDAVGTGTQAFINARTTEYDVIILDLMLPELDGLTVLSRLRQHGVGSAVLILTAKDTVDDRVLGLRTGADDYLIKPFAFAELLARVEVLTRRLHGVRSPVIRVGPLEIDTSAKTARLTLAGASHFSLTPREYSVLEYMAHRAGRPVSRVELEEHLYDDRSQVMSNAVDSAVCSIRAKLEDAGCPPLIRTRRKLGYVLEAGQDD